MKRFVALLLLFLAVCKVSAGAPQTVRPLTQDEVLDLVKFHTSSAELVTKIQTLGIDFEPTDDYLTALRKAGAQEPVIDALNQAQPKQLKPLTKKQVGELVIGGIPSDRTTMLVKQYGVNFVPDQDYLRALRVAGANDALIAALREAGKAVMGQLAVGTSPGAEVFLDGASQGQADAKGNLTIKVPPGPHALKVSLAAKKDYEKTVDVHAGQVVSVDAALTHLRGNLKVQTSPGATVLLDGSTVGQAGSTGQFAVEEVTPGSHELRITAQGKKEFHQNITIVAGQEATIEALLKNPASPAAETVHEKPKDPPPYSGPVSGTLVWQGLVKGTTLITINGSQSDQGEVMSGALPGVLVLLQPADAKHVVIASPPAPRNGFQRLALRIQGKGMVRESIQWSIP